MNSAYPELLKGLSEDDAGRVLALATRIQLPSGSELFSLGSTADSIYVVQRGRVSLTLPMQVRGREEDVLVEERGPGQTVGWSALIPPYRFTLKGIAPLDTEVLAFSRDTLRQHFAACPSAGYVVTLNLASVIGQRLQLFQAMWIREMQRMVESRCS